MARPYPYPYGFVIGTTAADGCNVDCFVISDTPLRRGQVVECEVLGLMEQIEDGLPDHNVVARLLESDVQLDESVRHRLVEFVSTVFSDVPGKTMKVGRFLAPDVAQQHIAERHE